MPDFKHILLKPPHAQGSWLRVACEGEGAVSLGVRPGEAIFIRNESDLVVGKPDGDLVILPGFFTPSASGELPDFMLPDGRILGAAEFFSLYGPDIVLGNNPALKMTDGELLNSQEDAPAESESEPADGHGFQLEELGPAGFAEPVADRVLASLDPPAEFEAIMALPPAQPIFGAGMYAVENGFTGLAELGKDFWLLQLGVLL